MTLTVTNLHIDSYTNWLISQKYQTNTIRNYIFDLRLLLEKSNDILSLESLTNFITIDTGQNNHLRHLASLAKFCQFASDQKIIESNLFSLAKKHAYNSSPSHNIDLLLSQFSHSLARQHKSPITIKNYLGDIRQYISFCESKIF